MSLCKGKGPTIPKLVAHATPRLRILRMESALLPSYGAHVHRAGRCTCRPCRPHLTRQPRLPDLRRSRRATSPSSRDHSPAGECRTWGAATARYSIEAARRGASVTGLDSSADMLAGCPTTREDAGVHVELRLGDAATIPFGVAFDAGFIRICAKRVRSAWTIGSSDGVDATSIVTRLRAACGPTPCRAPRTVTAPLVTACLEVQEQSSRAMGAA